MYPENLFIGMMSGTSLDAVDALLVDFSPSPTPPLQLGLKILARTSLPIPDRLRQDLLDLHTPSHNELHRAQCASLELGRLYAHTIDSLLALLPECPRSAIQAVGIHGQTIRHFPDMGYTLQLNAPALIAEHTGLNIVSDFRSRDIAAGGQGAPLVPAFHNALLGSSSTSPTIVLNLGGIANISVLQTNTVKGWDCGPANMLMDAWCQRHTRAPFDAGGEWASSGQCLPELLAAFLSAPYFQLPPPKSTGRDYFNLAWLEQHCTTQPAATPANIQATLLSLSAESIAQDIAPLQPAEIWVGGGGAYNHALLKKLRQSLKERNCTASLESIASLGIQPCDLEALAFAWLAKQHLSGASGNIPAVTGAKGPRCLGSLTPG